MQSFFDLFELPLDGEEGADGARQKFVAVGSRMRDLSAAPGLQVVGPSAMACRKPASAETPGVASNRR